MEAFLAKKRLEIPTDTQKLFCDHDIQLGGISGAPETSVQPHDSTKLWKSISDKSLAEKSSAVPNKAMKPVSDHDHQSAGILKTPGINTKHNNLSPWSDLHLLHLGNLTRQLCH